MDTATLRSGPALSGQSSLGDLAGFLTAVAALLLTVVYVPGAFAVAVTVRLPIVFAAGTGGLVVVLGRARRRDAASIWLVALLVWSLLSALSSTVPLQSLLPELGDDGGWLPIAMYAGWWGLGRHLDRGGERQVMGALVVGALLNVALAFVQALSDGRGTELLDFTYGRSMGFFGNPVYLGGFLAGALALVAGWTWRSTRPNRWLGLAAVAAVAAGVNLSGSRIALVAALIATLGALRGADRRRALAVLGAVAVGFAVTVPIIGQSGGSRLASGEAGGGITPRVETWIAGGKAVVERPVLGWGPGRWQEATAPHRTLRESNAESPDKVFDNGHNLLAEQTVTTGVVGLVLLVGFGWAAGRKARGPCAWFAVGSAITWLFEPMQIAVAPLALLALGTAARDRPPPTADGTTGAVGDAVAIDDVGSGRSSSLARVAVGVAVVLAAAGSIPYLAADRAKARALDAKQPLEQIEYGRDALRWLPFDAGLSDDLAISKARAAMRLDDRLLERRALAQARRTVELDPSNGLYRARYAMFDGMWGPGSKDERLARERSLLLHALDMQPWSPVTLSALHSNSLARADTADAARWKRQLCLIDRCPPPKRPASGTGAGTSTGATSSTGGG